jgi:uncharacterized protein (DUF2062 family)
MASPPSSRAYFAFFLPFACARSLAATLFVAFGDLGLERILDALLASFLLVVMVATLYPSTVLPPVGSNPQYCAGMRQGIGDTPTFRLVTERAGWL